MRSRSDLVRQVVRKLQQDGPLPTYRTVMNKLDSPQALGYATSGIVEAVGEGVSTLVPGDRVACAGAGYANHAELVVVPENLTAHVPENLPLEKAAFATLGAIAMQGLRVADPTLGEIVVVVGLGLIGQLTVQLLLANGCRVYGIDLDAGRVEESLKLGMDWGGAPGDDHGTLLAAVAGGHGADIAIVAAAAKTSAPVELAAELCRHKGRVVAVGATAMELDRNTFYGKKLELRMSMSYGPGRYDRQYEELGLDYPIAYARWTEQRNLQAFIDLAARGSIDPLALDVETVEFDDAPLTYEALAKGERSSLAALFRYAEQVDASRTKSLDAARPRRALGTDVGVAFIGAGNYAKGVLLPALGRVSGVRLQAVVTSTGPSARSTGERFSFENYGTDVGDVMSGEAVDLVFVTTQHDSHSAYAVEGIEAGKAVWLEKPVGLSSDEISQVGDAVRARDGFLMVGFNRRFSSHSRAIAEAFSSRSSPMSIQYTVAAGPSPKGTWITDPAVGGGRILGEACHFVDLCSFLVGEAPRFVYARRLSRDLEADDSTMALLTFPDGSVASLSYLANASSDLPKERFEVHCAGRTARCENYRTTRLPDGKTLKGMNQDKGQEQAVSETVEAVRSGSTSPISIDQVVSVSRATIALEESIRRGSVVEVCDV